ncbi:hypothetical protein MKX07_004468 [Trichoderma sp. CBMAI-0711]|uniref:Uncharacterized protein n=1 Tax=Trichoderma parareesei TaxID=858221 RepID=A0A2H2ZGR5_TRIPA|nr:hypothetical protein MKX07_004468 [Trichoderma sp. CBMAI-0711]OTA04968.1 hypothetical protein A9Z42_0055670 [Trichoderma parareesei]
MTKTNRLPKHNHHRRRVQSRDDNNYINSRHFIQTSNQESASESNDSSEYDTCSGYESAPGYDSSLEHSSEYDPFYGCSSSSESPSSFGSRDTSPDPESPDQKSDDPITDSNSPHLLLARKERIAQKQSSDATSNGVADAMDSKSNGSPDMTSSIASNTSKTGFSLVDANAFSSSRVSKE